MHDSPKNLSQKIVADAKKLGASAVDSVVVENISKSIEVKNGNLEKIEQSEKLSLGVRVFVGYRSACVSISNKSNSSLEQMIIRAIAMAKESPPDEFSALATKNQFLGDFKIEKFNLFDEYFNTAELDKLKSLAIEMEKSALSVSGISQCEGGINCNLSKFHMSSSNGFSQGYSKTGFQLFCSAIANDGFLMERDFATETRSFFYDLPEVNTLGHLAAKRAASRLNPKTPPTGSFPVLFDERVAKTLVLHLISAINGASIARGSSWLLNSLGSPVLPKKITLSEDPNRPKIAGSRPFDGEGLPTSKKDFVEDGKLKQLLLDLRSARQLNLKPCGNAFRSLAFPPYPSVGNIKLSSGKKSPSEIIQKIKSGFLVNSLMGSTINQNTGDYSRGASGFWIKNGEIAFPVNRCTIAGNLKEMLLNLIPANDSNHHLSYEVPSLLIEKMIVAGQ